MSCTLAVDVGGTKIAAGIMDDHNSWLSKIQRPSDPRTAETMYESLLNAIYLAINDAGIGKEQIGRFGIAVPGQVDIENGISVYSNNLPWRNFKLKEALEKEFPSCRIVIEHDVAAAAIGEYGVRPNPSDLFVYVTISTGLGAANLYKGEPIRGCGTSGEIGFFPVGDQILETFASGSSMEKQLRRRDPQISLSEAMDRWQQGDEALGEFFAARASQLALALFHISVVLDPPVIVVGGGVINNRPMFFEAIQAYYRALCTHPLQANWISKLEPSLLKGESGLVGAAFKALRAEAGR